MPITDVIRQFRVKLRINCNSKFPTKGTASLYLQDDLNCLFKFASIIVSLMAREIIWYPFYSIGWFSKRNYLLEFHLVLSNQLFNMSHLEPTWLYFYKKLCTCTLWGPWGAIYHWRHLVSQLIKFDISKKCCFRNESSIIKYQQWILFLIL